jgi:radical SAM protein with 4Fe4S-binding SPASM domain
VWNLNTNISLDHIPDLFSFIVVRKEYFGGYLYNPYLQEPIAMNEIGSYIVELCNGCNSVGDIIKKTADKFSLPAEVMKSIVFDALLEFNNYLAIIWRKELRSQQKEVKQIQPIFDKNNILSAPLSVIWDITYKCNLKCKHCYLSANEQKNNELELQEVKEIIDQLAEMKILSLNFLGGEPLVRNDFPEILEYATQKNIRISFSTNGVLVNDQLIAKLSEIEIYDVQISLDGLEETHNNIRGLKTSFQKATKAIKKLVASGIKVSISMAVNKLNLNEIKPLIEHVISFGASSFKVIPFLPAGQAMDNYSLMLSKNEMKEFIKSIVKYKDEFKEQIYIYTEDIYTWLVDKSVPEPSSLISKTENISCSAGMTQIVISPTGLVYACPFLHDFVVGDLQKETLHDIWFNSKILEKFRQISRDCLKGKCKNCGYIPQHCKGGCRAAAYLLTGDFYAEDPFCWYEPEN